mgnify:FL=1
MKIQVDIKTWAIIILTIAVILMALLSNGGGGAELKKLLHERDLQNKELQEKMDERDKNIKELKKSAAYYMEQDSIKGKALLELERLTEKKQQQIDALKKRMNSSAKPIDDATNEQRIEFWREYFARKGIKE